MKKAGSLATVRSFSGVDVSDENGINEMFSNIQQEFGKVDIIVNNAGVSGPVKTFTNASFQDFKDCVAIHLTGTFWTSVQALKVTDQQHPEVDSRRDARPSTLLVIARAELLDELVKFCLRQDGVEFRVERMTRTIAHL